MGLLALDHTRLRFGGIVALDVIKLEVVDGSARCYLSFGKQSAADRSLGT
jgi:hypothetical protein